MLCKIVISSNDRYRLRRVQAGVDVRLIESLQYGGKWGGKMKSQGVDLTQSIRLQPNVHNKGFVVDSNRRRQQSELFPSWNRRKSRCGSHHREPGDRELFRTYLPVGLGQSEAICEYRGGTSFRARVVKYQVDKAKPAQERATQAIVDYEAQAYSGCMSSPFVVGTIPPPRYATKFAFG